MPDATSTVLVIDDDSELRASVGRLLRSVGVTVQLFGSIADFLGSDPPDGPTCLVLDVRLPGQSGLDLQRELAEANRELPIVFVTGHGDIHVRAGDEESAIEFLREREIVIQVARGCLNKQVAHDTGIAEATVKVHRSRAMQKMKAGSLPDLGRMADKTRRNARKVCAFFAMCYSRGRMSQAVAQSPKQTKRRPAGATPPTFSCNCRPAGPVPRRYSAQSARANEERAPVHLAVSIE